MGVPQSSSIWIGFSNINYPTIGVPPMEAPKKRMSQVDPIGPQLAGSTKLSHRVSEGQGLFIFNHKHVFPCISQKCNAYITIYNYIYSPSAVAVFYLVFPGSKLKSIWIGQKSKKKTKRGVQPPLFLEHIVWFPPGILAKSPAKSHGWSPLQKHQTCPQAPGSPTSPAKRWSQLNLALSQRLCFKETHPKSETTKKKHLLI